MGIRSRPTGVCPRLLYNLAKDSFKNDDVSSGPSPDFLHGKKVLSCSHGWLVLYDYTKKNCLSLCNSTTFDDNIPLPSLDLIISEPGYKIDSCVLISSSSDPNNSLKVLLFLENVQSIMWCRVGDDVWGEIKYGKQLESLRPKCIGTCSFFSRAVSFGSTINAVLWEDGIRRFEGICSIEIVEEPSFGFGNMSRFHPPTGCTHLHSVCSFGDSYILESCGELFWVGFEWGDIRSVETLMVEVYRYSKRSNCVMWGRVTTLKDRAFFLGDHYCFSCHASGSPGHIYFTPTSKDERSIYCYNIEDKSVLITSDQYCSQENNNAGGDSNNNNNNCGPKEEEEGDYLGEEKQMLELVVDDVLEEITKHFTPLDYMDFRSVNRRFRSVSPLANWTRALSRSSSPLKTSHAFPLLMFEVGETKNQIYKLVDSRLNSIYYMMTIPNSQYSLIDYSKHGWLLTTRTRQEVNLYNPFTKNLISFPYAGQRAILVHDSFFFVMKPPSQTSDTNFLVVSVSFLERTRIFVSSIHPGETNWALHELHSNRSFSAAHTSPVLFRDSFYYLDCNGNIGKLKIEERQEGGKYMMSWQVLDELRKPCNSFHPNFLVECGGKLLSVCVEYGGTSVVVCKFNEAEMAWEAMMSLGNYALYLSRSSSFSLPVASRELRNRIYFPSFRGSEIVFFSLDTSKWHFSGSGDSSRHVYGTRYHLNSCWIQPSWC